MSKVAGAVYVSLAISASSLGGSVAYAQQWHTSGWGKYVLPIDDSGSVPDNVYDAVEGEPVCAISGRDWGSREIWADFANIDSEATPWYWPADTELQVKGRCYANKEGTGPYTEVESGWTSAGGLGLGNAQAMCPSGRPYGYGPSTRVRVRTTQLGWAYYVTNTRPY